MGTNPHPQIKYCNNDITIKRVAILNFVSLSHNYGLISEADCYFSQAILRKKPQIKLMKFCCDNSAAANVCA